MNGEKQIAETRPRRNTVFLSGVINPFFREVAMLTQAVCAAVEKPWYYR